MITTKRINKCKQIRKWLYKTTSRYVGPEAKWVQKHVINCPRCQQRFASYSRVNLTLSLMKSQPHSLDLLTRANIRTVDVLKHSLRTAPKAQKLRIIKPESGFMIRWGRCACSAMSLTACIVIIMLMKIGIFSSMDKLQTQSQKAFNHYYANHVGQDIADELFPEKSSSNKHTDNPPSTAV